MDAALQSPALLQKIQVTKNLFSKTEQRVLDYIEKNPGKVIYLSVAGLADAAGVSDATVVRACQKLGLAGYQELKLTLAQSIVTPQQSIHEEIAPDDAPAVVIDKVFNSTIYALNFTHSVVRPETLDRAAELISHAKRTAIYGLGNSHAVAVDLQHKLMRLGIDATAYTDSHMEAISAAYCGPEDVVFAISHSGSSRDVVDSVRVARKNGAKVITLTNSGITPLGREADIALYTASEETRYRIVALSSRIAQFTIIDVLYTLIAMRRPGVVDGFHRIEKSLQLKKY